MFRLELSWPADAAAVGASADDLPAALGDGLAARGFHVQAAHVKVEPLRVRPIHRLICQQHAEAETGRYSVAEFMAAHRTLEDQAFGVLHELLAFGVRDESSSQRLSILSCTDRRELGRQMHDWLDRHPRLAARLKLARPAAASDARPLAA